MADTFREFEPPSYNELAEFIKPLLANKPLSDYSLEEAESLVILILEKWQILCRTKAGIEEDYSFLPTRIEASYIPKVTKQANPDNFIPSIIEGFQKLAIDEVPF